MATDAGSTGAAAGGTGPTGRDRSMRPPWLPLIAAAVVVPAVLAGLTLLWSAPQIEGTLTERAQAALSAAGISGAGVRFDGRDATITGLTGAAAERAAQVVAGATGVRVAVVGGGAGAAPVPPPPPGPAPAPVPAPARRPHLGLRPLRGRHRRLAPSPRLLQRRRLHRRLRLGRAAPPLHLRRCRRRRASWTPRRSRRCRRRSARWWRPRRSPSARTARSSPPQGSATLAQVLAAVRAAPGARLGASTATSPPVAATACSPPSSCPTNARRRCGTRSWRAACPPTTSPPEGVARTPPRRTARSARRVEITVV